MERHEETCSYCGRILTLDKRYLSYTNYALRHRIKKGRGEYHLTDVCQDCYEGNIGGHNMVGKMSEDKIKKLRNAKKG